MPRRRKTFTPVEPEGEHYEFACPIEDAPEPEVLPEGNPEPEPLPEPAPEPKPEPEMQAHVKPDRTKLYPHREGGARQSNRRLRFTR